MPLYLKLVLLISAAIAIALSYNHLSARTGLDGDGMLESAATVIKDALNCAETQNENQKTTREALDQITGGSRR